MNKQNKLNMYSYVTNMTFQISFKSEVLLFTLHKTIKVSCFYEIDTFKITVWCKQKNINAILSSSMFKVFSIFVTFIVCFIFGYKFSITLHTRFWLVTLKC